MTTKILHHILYRVPHKKPVLVARLARFPFAQFEYIFCVKLRATRIEIVGEAHNHNYIIVVP